MKRGKGLTRTGPIARTAALVAHKGLTATTGLSRSTPLDPGPPLPRTGRRDGKDSPQRERRREQLATWAEIKQQAAQRDGFRCIGCGTDQWLETHHRHLKQAGGSKLHDHIANALTLCREHHEYAHAHRNTKAIALGWCVLQGENPAVHPVRHHDGGLYLHDDDGGRRRVG